MSDTTPQGNPTKPIDVEDLEDPNFDETLPNGSCGTKTLQQVVTLMIGGFMYKHT